MREKSFSQIARYHGRIHVAILDLQRQAAFEMNQQGVIELRPRRDTAALRQLAWRRDGTVEDDLRQVVVAAQADLVGDVANFQRMRLCTVLGDEGADTGDPDQHAISGQLAQGAVRGHARNIQLTYQLVFGRHAVPDRQRAGRNSREHELFHLQIARGGWRGSWLALGEAVSGAYPATAHGLVYTGIVDLHTNSGLLRNPPSCISGFAPSALGRMRAPSSLGRRGGRCAERWEGRERPSGHSPKVLDRKAPRGAFVFWASRPIFICGCSGGKMR